MFASVTISTQWNEQVAFSVFASVTISIVQNFYMPHTPWWVEVANDKFKPKIVEI